MSDVATVLEDIKGIGPAKLEQYGDAVLGIVGEADRTGAIETPE